MNILKKKHKQEKRRRFQTYNKLDYILNMTTLADFFSSDLLTLIQLTSSFEDFFENKTITNSLNTLIFNFFLLPNSTIDIIIKKTNFKLKDFFNRFIKIISEEKVNLYLTKAKSLKTLNLSKDLNTLFNLSADFTFSSLKTPVISTKIFFLYILDYLYALEYPTKKGEITENFLKFLTERFCFLKEIYKEELYIRNTIDNSQIYFAYLLKIYLSDFEFNQLIKLNFFKRAVEIFRNILISKIIKINILKSLNKDVNKTIRLNKGRLYTV